MIIYDGEKYACVSCIRGHRSSTCRHTNRMLVKVRNRGRHGSLDIRKVIIVDTESQVLPDEKSPSCDGCNEIITNTDGKECERMNKQPILFLKTIQSQKAVLSDGKLKIIVEENKGGEHDEESASENDQRYKYLSEKEFLRQNSIDLGSYGFRDLCACQGKTTPSYRKSFKETAGPPATKLESEDTSIQMLEASEMPVFKPEEVQLQPISHSFALNDIGTEYHKRGSINSAYTNTMAKDTDRKDSGPYHADPASIPVSLNQKPMVELLTHKGLYLSTQCSCADDNCLCANCLLHRNEKELQSYIQRSGVPLTNLGEAQLANSARNVQCAWNCKCPDDECLCKDCLDHPTDILSFNRLLFNGIFNVHLKKKTIINYKGRLIPSQYWWDFLKLQVPLMTDTQLDSLDIISWFDNIISAYSSQLVDMNAFNIDSAPAMFGL